MCSVFGFQIKEKDKKITRELTSKPIYISQERRAERLPLNPLK